MATKTYQIGSFTFFSADPTPQGLVNPLTFETRVGVEGYSAWKGARRGKPFTLFTEAGAANLVAAGVLAESYLTAQQDGLPLTLIWADITSVNKVLIVNVDSSIEDLVLGVTSAGVTFNALLRAKWDLLTWEV